jgi:hypothetical protein
VHPAGRHCCLHLGCLPFFPPSTGLVALLHNGVGIVMECDHQVPCRT